jgi:hypothetical protein
MSMSYTIDPDRRLVLTRGRGVISSGDLHDLTNHIRVDPAFDPNYRSLADLTEVTGVTVDSMDTAQTAAMPLFNPGTRRAIVAPGDVVYASALLFASYAERAGQDVRVFRELAHAKAWLEL